ncbi:MAG: hypothetical protein IH989_01375 [Planctomycetes bacterium]|nr:hypothetical protein [Planctomycetota bacterium]
MEHQLVLFEDEGFVDLLPLTFWRSVFELQVGRKILMDRTSQRLGLPLAGVWTREWLARVAAHRCGAPANQSVKPGTVLVNGRWLFDESVRFPETPAVGIADDTIVWIVCDKKLASNLTPGDLLDPDRRKAALTGLPEHKATGRVIRYAWDVIGDLPNLLEQDWKESDAWIEAELDPNQRIHQRERIHIGERSKINPTAVLDASAGPIFISFEVEIGAYAVIEGPAYIGAQSRVQPHSWLHGANVIGPVCRVGGEITGCVFHSYSNKAHAGFLGHSYVGSWVNLGAGSTNSNLKNTYGKVRVPINGVEVDTGQQFFGAIIADHAKIGINAAISTGSAIGLAAGIARTRILPKYIPSFSWVTDNAVAPGDVNRLLDVASAVMARRNIDMTDDEVELFLDLGERVRTFEKAPRKNGVVEPD